MQTFNQIQYGTLCCSPQSYKCRGPKAIIAEATHAQLGRALQQGLLALPEANKKLLLCPLRQPDHQNSFRTVATAAKAVSLCLQVRERVNELVDARC
jgi:hypothetical protein